VKAAGEAGAAPRIERRQEVEAGAEAQLGDPEAVAEPRRQVVAGEEDVPGLREAVVQRIVRVVEPARDRDVAVAPQGLGLVAHAPSA